MPSWLARARSDQPVDSSEPHSGQALALGGTSAPQLGQYSGEAGMQSLKLKSGAFQSDRSDRVAPGAVGRRKDALFKESSSISAMSQEIRADRRLPGP